jgi:hypothetical protein
MAALVTTFVNSNSRADIRLTTRPTKPQPHFGPLFFFHGNNFTVDNGSIYNSSTVAILDKINQSKKS